MPGGQSDRSGRGCHPLRTWEGWHWTSGHLAVWDTDALLAPGAGHAARSKSHTSLCRATHGPGDMCSGCATALALFALGFHLLLSALVPNTSPSAASAPSFPLLRTQHRLMAAAKGEDPAITGGTGGIWQDHTQVVNKVRHVQRPEQLSQPKNA